MKRIKEIVRLPSFILQTTDGDFLPSPLFWIERREILNKGHFFILYNCQVNYTSYRIHGRFINHQIQKNKEEGDKTELKEYNRVGKSFLIEHILNRINRLLWRRLFTGESKSFKSFGLKHIVSIRKDEMTSSSDIKQTDQWPLFEFCGPRRKYDRKVKWKGLMERGITKMKYYSRFVQSVPCH